MIKSLRYSDVNMTETLFREILTSLTWIQEGLGAESNVKPPSVIHRKVLL